MKHLVEKMVKKLILNIRAMKQFIVKQFDGETADCKRSRLLERQIVNTVLVNQVTTNIRLIEQLIVRSRLLEHGKGDYNYCFDKPAVCIISIGLTKQLFVRAKSWADETADCRGQEQQQDGTAARSKCVSVASTSHSSNLRQR